MVAGSSLWDVPQIDMGLSSVGSIAILYDESDRPIELQILDSKERVVSRCIRTYDVNGRIMEENYIPENPASGRSSGELDDKQFETMNEALKMVFSGRRGTGKSFTYDSQGRVTEVRDRNWAADTVTTTGYNEHGDKSEERMTTTNNLALPIDGVSEMPPGAGGPWEPMIATAQERTLLTIVEYRYEYQNGNWTERTKVHRQVVDSSESGARSKVYRRTLTYF